MAHVDRSEVCATSPLVSISVFSLISTFPANARLQVRLFPECRNVFNRGLLDRLITSKDHASVQISIVDVDATGRALNTSTTFALCGQVRSQGESDDSINRLATKAGLLRNVWSYQK
ncbi:hypothetical protein C0992_001859 [Termitomyces sp. T32_za158]|nr:hypothetical protein C0992_001859 [Termitomyces sp. T32_za158]